MLIEVVDKKGLIAGFQGVAEQCKQSPNERSITPNKAHLSTLF
jgi:hypothetical protein